MTVGPPTADPRTIEAYARELVGKGESRPGSARVLALAADPAYHGPTLIEVEGTEVAVVGCVSTLAVREALGRVPDGGYAIVLTDRPVEDLGDSLVAQFRRQRVEPLDPWTTVPGMFGGKHLDAGLRQSMPWLPEALFTWAPPGGYPTSTTELVTRTHILGALTAAVLGIPADEVGLSSLLERLGDLDARTAWAGLPPEARAAISDWVGEYAGPAAAAVLTLAAAESTAHVNVHALGLMLDVLYGDPDAGADVVEARRGWENGYRLPRVSGAAAAQVGAASRTRMRLLAETDPGARHEVWRDTAEAFAIAGFPNGIVHSPSHPDGYRARLADVGRYLGEALSDGPSAAPRAAAIADLERAATRLQAHDLAWSDHRGDTERVAMAVRLVRWLASDHGTPPAALADALVRQVAVDGWVDRAVADVWSGSTHTQVAAAYRELCTAVLAVRREHDRQFAALLAEVTSREVLPAGILPVENVLIGRIRPLTEVAPVLLIVIDGMSAAVAAAIGEGISRLAWVEHVPAGESTAGAPATRAAVLSALPTMTRYSRASLLCGTLREGTQADEKREFTRVTGGSLFHKDDLRTPAGASVNPVVDSAIGSPSPVVGVVLNTVDDTLAKHDPDGTRWTVPVIQHLEPLLEVARTHGRTVVITSDHGHVVERGGRTEWRELADARWRPASTGPAGPEEVLLAGPRVMAGGGAVVAPWVEDLRYGKKAAGYHGGASAAEVTIPMLVFAGRGVDLSAAGWQPSGVQAPWWWDEAIPAPPRPGPAAAPKPPRRVRTRTVPDGDALFEVQPGTDATDVPGPAAAAASGTGESAASAAHHAAIDDCLASAAYRRSRAAAGRAALPDETVRQVLHLLISGGGRASSDQVARALGVPTSRLSWALTGLRRLLNLEGYQVVSMDADGRTVLLDEPLWRTQFGVSA